MSQVIPVVDNFLLCKLLIQIQNTFGICLFMLLVVSICLASVKVRAYYCNLRNLLSGWKMKLSFTVESLYHSFTGMLCSLR